MEVVEVLEFGAVIKDVPRPLSPFKEQHHGFDKASEVPAIGSIVRVSIALILEFGIICDP